MAKNPTGGRTGNMEWGRKARKEEDRLRGRNNTGRRDAIEEWMEDSHEVDQAEVDPPRR